jgi:hypothetical protein
MLRKWLELWRHAHQRQRPHKCRSVRLFAEPLESRWVPVSSTWKATAAGDWSTADNWTAGVPGVTQGVDTAVFDGTSTKNCTLVEPGGVIIKRLTISNAYTGTLKVNQPLYIDRGSNPPAEDSSMAGGVINILEVAYMGIANGTVFNWTGGQFTRTGVGKLIVWDANSKLNIEGAASQLGVVLDNRGTVTVNTTGDLTMGGGTYIDNYDIFDIKVDKGILYPSGSSTFNNLGGTLKKSAGSGTATVELVFGMNSGNLEVVTGTLKFTSTAGQGGGTTKLSNNASLQTTNGYSVSGGIFEGGANSTVIGNLSVSGGTVRPGGDTTIGSLNVTGNYTQTGGTLSMDINVGAGTNDRLVVDTAPGGTVTLQSGGQNAGTLTANTLNGIPAIGTKYNIITYQTLVGDFATKNLSIPGANPPRSYRTQQVAIPPGVPNTYQLEVIQDPGGGGGEDRPSPLALHPSSTSGTATGKALASPQVQPLLAEAIARWRAAGVGPESWSTLSQVAVHIADLPGPYLGLASADAIWIDHNAAGVGWFIDPTPADDHEFPAAADSPAYGRVDLLTVLAHELGHLLGFKHSDAADSVMAETLAAGIRRVPVPVATQKDMALGLANQSAASNQPLPNEADSLSTPNVGSLERPGVERSVTVTSSDVGVVLAATLKETTGELETLTSSQQDPPVRLVSQQLPFATTGEDTRPTALADDERRSAPANPVPAVLFKDLDFGLLKETMLDDLVPALRPEQ